ncbi:MAG: hypothetical protein KTR16_08630 [Acidiferrobacterales bacterium]|nr:hypothetical protein [Acidiferrobacterales bacterium]
MKNEEITLRSLPAVGDLSEISKFAGSFNGYKHFGSFEATAEASLNSKRESLTELRNELFFSWRASRHGMGDEFVETYEELYPYFVKILE